MPRARLGGHRPTTKILHLTLKKKWFVLIKKNQKKTEYREIKPYWTKRLQNKQFKEIHFRNGYRKDSPFMRVECLGIKKEKRFYAIKLGKILEEN